MTTCANCGEAAHRGRDCDGNIPRCGKAEFKTEAAAKAARAMGTARLVSLRPYLCPRCGFWHLTSRGDG